MIRLVLLSLWLTTGVALAQSVPVRSGEHPTFSRLVLTLPDGTGWQIGREAEGYLLELDRPLDFQLAGVFDRLPEARIGRLVQTAPGLLSITASCACHVTAFLWRDNRLVIDVTLGPAPEGSPFEAPLQVSFPEQPPPTARTASAPNILPLIIDRAAARAPLLLPNSFSELTDDAARLTEAGDALRESIARAATAGLLTPNVPFPVPVSGPDAPPTVDVPELLQGAPAPASISVATADPPMPPAQPGIAFVTAPERARMDVSDLADAHCFPDEQVAVAEWVATTDFATEIGQRRAAILTTDETLLAPAIEDLAKAYLHFGFGLEAEQTLGMDNVGSSERRVLVAMARLVDGRRADLDVFAGQANCRSAVAMWAALANDSVAGVEAAARIAIEAAHRALPSQLRLHLAAPLARAFLADGDATTAEAILSASRFVGDPQPLDVAMTAAEVELVVEGPDSAIATLTDMATTDDRMTADGLVRLIELSLSEGRPPEPDLLDLAAAMRFQARGTAIAEALLAAEVRANLLIRDFDKALELLDEGATALPDPSLRGEVAIAMAESATPTRFVEAIFDGLDHELTAEAANVVASRLLTLGFAERALTLVIADSDGPAMVERPYLRAEAALALGRVMQAEAALTGLDDPRADNLRAEIRAYEGDFVGALAAVEEEFDPELAWRAGDWQALGQDVDPLRSAASAARIEPPTDLDSDTPLAVRSTLLEQSEFARDLTEQLLGEFPDPGPLEPVGSATEG